MWILKTAAAFKLSLCPRRGSTGWSYSLGNVANTKAKILSPVAACFRLWKSEDFMKCKIQINDIGFDPGYMILAACMVDNFFLDEIEFSDSGNVMVEKVEAMDCDECLLFSPFHHRLILHVRQLHSLHRVLH